MNETIKSFTVHRLIKVRRLYFKVLRTIPRNVLCCIGRRKQPVANQYHINDGTQTLVLNNVRRPTQRTRQLKVRRCGQSGINLQW